MDGIGVRDLGGRDDRRNVQIGELALGRSDTDSLIGKAYVQRSTVCLGIDGNGLDAELFRCANDAQGDLATVGDQEFGDHAQPSQSGLMTNIG